MITFVIPILQKKSFSSEKSAKFTLRDVQGNPLSHHGTRHVNLRVGTQGQQENIDFQIADVSDNMFSPGQRLRKGFVFSLKRENDSIMYHQSNPTTTLQLFLHKNSLRVHARPFVQHVSLVVVDDFRSSSNLLDCRSDELALPTHGTKLDEWTRLEERENGLVRERTSLAAIGAEREGGPERRHRYAVIPMSDRREPSSTEKEVHEVTHRPPQPWCE